MIINHNMPAMNSYNALNKTDNTINKSLEKLSTGLRINRAGDDAAGLAISEKMRGQVNGLNMATRNSQDGISMIQTAEGALNETHSILQRMRELSVQSANGTNTAEDREALQSEVTELKAEIDRIGETTEFNTQKLLKGTGAAAKEVGALKLEKTGAVEQKSLEGGKVQAETGATIQLSLGAATTTASSLNGESFTFKFNGNSVKLSIETVATNSEAGANTFNVIDGGNEVKLTLVDTDTDKDAMMRRIQEALTAAMTTNTNVDETNYTISRDNGVVSINSVNKGEGETISIVGTATSADLAFRTVDNSTSAATPNAFAFVDNTIAGNEAVGTAEVRTKATIDIDSFDAANIRKQVLSSGIDVANTDYFDAGGSITQEGAMKFLDGKGFTIGDETVEFFDSNNGAYTGTADLSVDLALVNWDTTGAATATLDAMDTTELVKSIADQIGDKLKDVTITATNTAGTETAAAFTTAKTTAATTIDTLVQLNVAGAAAFAAGDGTAIVATISAALANGGAGDADAALTAAVTAELGLTGNDLSQVVESIKSNADYKALLGGNLTVTAKDPGEAGNNIEIKDGTDRAASDIVGSTFSVTFQIGANNAQTMNFSITDMRSAALGIDKIDLSTAEGAQSAITSLDKAISKVSSQRAKLGAVQNRLEHTINNLTTSSENLQAAESRVRDVDMSLEMVAFSKNKIISQAGTSMLSQANQNPQNVLSLLR